MRKFILICLALAAFAVPARADEPVQRFPLNCTRGTEPLKSCLVTGIIDHVMLGPVGDKTSQRAVSQIVDAVAEYGSIEQKEKLVDRLIDQVDPRNLHSEGDLWQFSVAVYSVALLGNASQIQKMADKNASLPDYLHKENIGKVSSFPFDRSMRGHRAVNELKLELGLGKIDTVVSTMHQIEKNEKFAMKPDYWFSNMATLLMRRNKPEEALNLIQETYNIKFNASGATVGGFPEPTPLLHLILTFLENGDIPKARQAKNLCEQSNMYGFDCTHSLEYLRDHSGDAWKAIVEKDSHDMLHVSNAKKTALKKMLLEGHLNQGLNTVSDVIDLPQWIFSQNDLSDHIQKQTFEKFWPQFDADVRKGEMLKLRDQMNWDQESKEAAEASMAGLKDAFTLAEFLTDSKPTSAFDALTDKYPKAIASLDKILSEPAKP